MATSDDSPCDRCWKRVHLPHDPPCLDCGAVLCPECGPHDCEAVDAETAAIVADPNAYVAETRRRIGGDS